MNRRAMVISIGVLVIFLVFQITQMSKKNDVAKSSPGEMKAQELYDQALNLKQKRKLNDAKVIYRTILTEYPDIENVENIQKELELINMNLILTNFPSPQSVTHEVQSGDTLGKLAKRYGTTVELIKRKNGLKNDVIRVGQRLNIWTGQFNIYVDKSQNTLLLRSGNEIVKVYAVSTGENNSTPIGTFAVTSKLVDPVWFNRGVVVPPESPSNVLGSRWLGFDLPGYGIHGTIEPDTIGQQITAGCVRMRNQEVEELYSMIPVGTQVVIVD